MQILSSMKGANIKYQAPLISVNNIWKKYKIGAPKKLTEAISSFISGQKQKEFWALKNIDLSIKEGEIVGIIGPNGSGKSTLLKVLAGVTYPTKGTISVRGRVASLLELGTGFHQELTGSENIFLYGSILGISSSDIKNKFSEIVSFAGVEEFIDTPVKHYSSGMYVRLAFSVSTHLDFDILLLDEVLAVGDAQFQQKSLAKIKEIVGQNKTVVIVGHNLESMIGLCQKLVLINKGKIEKVGDPKKIIDYYLKVQELDE